MNPKLTSEFICSVADQIKANVESMSSAFDRSAVRVLHKTRLAVLHWLCNRHDKHHFAHISRTIFNSSSHWELLSDDSKRAVISEWLAPTVLAHHRSLGCTKSEFGTVCIVAGNHPAEYEAEYQTECIRLRIRNVSGDRASETIGAAALCPAVGGDRVD